MKQSIPLITLLLSSTDAFTSQTKTRLSLVSNTHQRASTIRTNMVSMPELMEPATVTAAWDSISSILLSDDAAIAPTYSKASYYTTLGLYIMSFPGIYSQIKRSTVAKSKRKTYVTPGEAAAGGQDLRQTAGEIMAFMKANNYEVAEAGEVITFRGLVKKSTSQAFFLTFCTALGMASLALVLQIQFIDFQFPLGLNWFYLVLLSPYAGFYYWGSGDRVDDIQVKLETNEADTENEITVEGK